MSRIAYVNGQYVPHSEACVHIDDRGYQFADSVYEVFSVQDGNLVGEVGHLDRLQHSLSSLEMDWPMKPAPMMVVCREVMRRNHVRTGIIYLQVSRGVAPRNHAFPKTKIPSSFVVTAKKTAPPDPAKFELGVSVITVPDIRWKRRDIKSTSLLPNILNKQKAAEVGSYEAWQIDDDGFVTEGTSSNAWIVTKEGDLVTREASHSILNGITRLGVLEAAEEAGIPFVERAFTPEEAFNAKEAFLTSSSANVKAVTKIDDRPIGNGRAGPLTIRIDQAYMSLVKTHGGPQKTDVWNNTV